jgi:cytoskeletal protein CcmA (bactofilin family)
MWKKEDARPQGVPEISTGSAGPSTSSGSRDGGSLSASGRTAASIGQGIRIKGEITGSEDLFVDGPVEGKLQLANGSLTIGPNGSVKADVTAREVIVRGRLEGKIAGRDRIQVLSTGHVTGEVQTQRLAIEDGAFLRGKVETGKTQDKGSDGRDSASAGKTSGNVAVGSGTAVI